MAANPLTVEDLITRAIQAGEIVQGINDRQAFLQFMRDVTERMAQFYAHLAALEVEHAPVRDWPKGEQLTLALQPEVELITKALRVAGSPERLAEWLQTPVPALNGQTPYSLMQTEEGRKQVEDVLGRIEHGIY